MSPVQYDSSGTTWSLMRRAPPVSQKTISILIATCVAGGVTILAITIVALLRCWVRRRKHEVVSQAIVDHQRSPIDSFIQLPPRLIETPDVEFNRRSTPSPAVSSNTGQEEHLVSVMRWTTVVKPKESQDFGTGASSLRTSTVSQSESGNMLVGPIPSSGSFDNPDRPESSESTYSTASSSSSQISPALRPQSASPSLTQAEIHSELRTEHSRPPQRHAMMVADVETMSFRSTSTVTQSKIFGSRPGLPSSPAASLARSQFTSKDSVPSQVPPLPENPHITSAFLDSPPKRKRHAESHGRGHSRSLSSSALPHNVERGRSQMETSDSTCYASVAYAREKALESARPRARSLTTTSPHPHARPKTRDHEYLETHCRKSEKGLSLLSLRPRSHARSNVWSATGKEPPERI